jgi:hypothetical protein
MENEIIQIVDIFNKLPKPRMNEKHLCPCYEQIFGAFYSLVLSNKFGIKTRNLEDYHNQVRLKLAESLSESFYSFDSVTKEFSTWASGFYFNSAIQRLIWVADRVLTIFGRLSARCCKDAPNFKTSNIGIKWILVDARTRLKHECFYSASNIKKVVNMLDNSEKFNINKDIVTENNYLKAIRWDVNQRKHAIGGFHRSSSNKVKEGPWVKLGQDQQFKYTIMAFDLICKAYSDLDNLYFEKNYFKNSDQ